MSKKIPSPRTSQEILKEMPNDAIAAQNLARAQVDILQLVLETLVDIRDGKQGK